MNAHTHTHTHTHIHRLTHAHAHTHIPVAYHGNETEEKFFLKRKVLKEDLKELTEGWYSEHLSVCRRAELLGRSVKVKMTKLNHGETAGQETECILESIWLSESITVCRGRYRVTDLEKIIVWISKDEAPMPLPAVGPLLVSTLLFHLLGACHFGLFHLFAIAFTTS